MKRARAADGGSEVSKGSEGLQGSDHVVEPEASMKGPGGRSERQDGPDHGESLFPSDAKGLTLLHRLWDP